MQRYNIYFLCFWVGITTVPVLAQSAKTKPEVVITPTDYQRRQIMVGRGGGISGQETTYYLLENGNLFSRNGFDSTYTRLRWQTPATTKRLFSTVENTCKIKTTSFDQPGNMYQFVGWQKGKTRNRVTWGAADKTPPAAYPNFYKSFMSMLPVGRAR